MTAMHEAKCSAVLHIPNPFTHVFFFFFLCYCDAAFGLGGPEDAVNFGLSSLFFIIGDHEAPDTKAYIPILEYTDCNSESEATSFLPPEKLDSPPSQMVPLHLNHFNQPASEGNLAIRINYDNIGHTRRPPRGLKPQD